MEQVKEKRITLLSVLFGTNHENITSDIEDSYTESSYIEGLKNDAEGPINGAKKSSKKGVGLKKKYEAQTIKIEEMTSEKLEEMTKKLQGKEITRE